MSRSRMIAFVLVAALGAVAVVASPAQAATVTVSGVVRTSSGVPVPDAAVTVFDAGGSSDRYVARTDAAGAYSVDLPALTQAWVRVDDPADVVQFQRVSRSDIFALTSSRIVNPVLPDLATLTVTVVLGAGGPPVAQARVRSTGAWAERTSADGLHWTTESGVEECVTASTGACALTVLEGGGVDGFTVGRSGQVTLAFAGISTPAGDETPATTLTLQSNFPVTGVLTSADRGALGGATVTLTSAQGSSVSTTTASDGSYSVSLPPGIVSLRVASTIDAYGSAVPFRLSADGIVLDRPRTLPLHLPSIGQLRISARDALDQPIPEVPVTMNSPSARTTSVVDGIGVVLELHPIGGPAATCRTGTQGTCSVHTLPEGQVGGLLLDLDGADPVPATTPPAGAVREIVARVPRYAAAASAAGPVTIVVGAARGVEAFTSAEVAPPAGIEPVTGLLRFAVDTGVVGGNSPVTVRLPADIAPATWFGVDAQGRWRAVSANGGSSTGTTLQVTDGGPEDQDGSADGVAVGAIAAGRVAPMAITTTSLPAVPTGKPYSAALAASGPGAPYTWTVSAGALPSGLVLAPSGVLSGTTSATGSFSVTVTAENAYGMRASRAITLTVSPVVVSTTSLADAFQGAKYSTTLKAVGAGGLPSWSVVGGSLPPGITLAKAGTLSGTPTASGRFVFSVRVANAGKYSPPQELVLVVRPMEVATANLATAPVATAYSQKLTTNGGKGTLTWSVAGGSLPPGLSLSSAGTLSGTPTTVGTWTVTVRVTDQSVPSQVATRTLTMTVTPMEITTATLPDAKKGQLYQKTLTVIGGKTTRTWSVIGGSLPAGLALSSGGKIAGYPKVLGSFTFTVRVQDASTPKNEATRTLTLTVR